MGAVAERLTEEFLPADWGLVEAAFTAKVAALETEALTKATDLTEPSKGAAELAWGLHRGYTLSYNHARRTPETRQLGPGEVTVDYKTLLTSLENERDRYLQEYGALTATIPTGNLKKQALGSLSVPAESSF